MEYTRKATYGLTHNVTGRMIFNFIDEDGIEVAFRVSEWTSLYGCLILMHDDTEYTLTGDNAVRFVDEYAKHERSAYNELLEKVL